MAPRGFTFYQGKNSGDLLNCRLCRPAWFVESTGKNWLSVDALIFKGGKPVEARTVLNLLSVDKTVTYGRPVDDLTLSDGSLLVTNDFGNKIYRLTARP